MNAKAFGLIVVVFGLMPGAATAEPARIGHSQLNLRASASLSAQIVARMAAGERVEVLTCAGDWCRLRYQGTSGFAMARHLERGSDEALSARAQAPVAVASTARPSASSSEDDRSPRIWRWQDPEWRDRHARDIQFLQRHSR